MKRRGPAAWLAWTSGACSVGIVGWELLRHTPVGDWWTFELLDIFGLGLFLPVPLLALAALAARSWRAGAWLMAPLALFGLQYGPLFLPRAAPEGPAGLRVMTANLLFTNADAEAFVGAVEAEGPAVVAVQELGSEMAERISRTLAERYPYQALAPSDSPDGIGLLSRFPFELQHEDPERSGCACQVVSLAWPERPLTLVNVHPLPPLIGLARVGPLRVPSFSASEQQQSFELLAEQARVAPGPLVMLGDFNLSERQPAYRRLRQHLRDAHVEAGAGFGFTFPSALMMPGLEQSIPPFLRIDHVLYSEHWSALAAWTRPLRGTDHQYVVAELIPR